MEPYHNRNRKDGRTIETQDYIVGQASNGHIQVYDRKTKSMVLHMNCTAMYTREKLQAFADRFQAANSRSIEATLDAMTALA